MSPSSRLVALFVVLAGLATAGVVILAGGGEAFWLCFPVVLLAAASSRTRFGAALCAATIVSLAAAPALVSHVRPPPSLPLALFIPAASVAVLIASRERLERERNALRRFALCDPLTGIANRRCLLERIEYEVARHNRGRSSFALLMLDLDGFKVLNDRFGHAAGDDLLRDVAAAIERALRRQDTVARIGGDEFCVLAPETDLPGARRLRARIESAVGDVTAGVDALHASSGVALFPDDGLSPNALLHAADQRLISAKRERQRGRLRSRAA
jgi:diguanylate cyclase (GGDEF)-like protein